MHTQKQHAEKRSSKAYSKQLSLHFLLSIILTVFCFLHKEKTLYFVARCFCCFIFCVCYTLTHSVIVYYTTTK